MNPNLASTLRGELDTLAGSGSLREQYILEGIYALSKADPSMLDLLARAAEPSPIAKAWHACLRGVVVVAPAERVPARTRDLLIWEHVARVNATKGATLAWQEWRALGKPGLLQLVNQRFANASPMVLVAIRQAIELSSSMGEWPVYDEFCSAVQAFELDDTHSALVQLTCLRAAMRRGHYQSTLVEIESRLETATLPTDLLLAFAALALEILANADTTGTSDDLSAPAQGRSARLRRLWDLARCCKQTVDKAGPKLLDTAEFEGWWQLASSVALRTKLLGPAERDHARLLDRLLAEEWDWRHEEQQNPERGQAIAQELEDLILDRRHSDAEQLIQAQLAWCRLRVDLFGRRTAQELDELDSDERTRVEAQGYEELRERLETLMDCETCATEMGFEELALRAMDQQIEIQVRLGEQGAADQTANRAGARVIELLRANVASEGSLPTIERGLLESMFPILDRSIVSRVEFALAGSDAAWESAGRAIHPFVEQSAVLALQEVRRVHTGESAATVPHRFAWAPLDPRFEQILAAIQQTLRPSQAVLQYFVSAHYVLVFTVTPSKVTWDLVGRRWSSIQDFDAEVEGDPTKLDLVPARVRACLRDPELQHVFVVPHASTWDLPFSKIFFTNDIGAATSFHPCCNEVLHVLKRKQRSRRMSGSAARRLLIGPRLLEPVVRSLEQPLSDRRFEPTATRGVETRRQLEECELACIVCHGDAPQDSANPGLLELDASGEPTNVHDFTHAELQRCRLIVLQSCWGGRIAGTRRNDPVLGVAQILCDAGAGTVISARSKIPQAFVPCMLDALEVLVQFLPVEQALRECLVFLNERWARLVELAPSMVSGGASSPYDLEYRLFGLSGIHATEASPVRRLFARARWWIWRRRPERWLARQEWLRTITCCCPSDSGTSPPGHPMPNRSEFGAAQSGPRFD